MYDSNSTIIQTTRETGLIIGGMKIPVFNSMTELKIEEKVSLITSTYDMSACSSNCSNHGNCAFKENIFKCLCDQFYMGPSCNVDTRPCSSNPCLNNGTCVDDFVNKTFKCECGINEDTNSTLYYGKNCELKIDVCANEKCSRNGNCIDFNNKPKCICFYLYNGTKCEIESTEIKSIKSVSNVSSMIAISVLCSLCLIFVVFDLVNFFSFLIKIFKKF